MRKCLIFTLVMLAIGAFISCNKKNEPEPDAKTTGVVPSGHFYTTISDGLVVYADSNLNTIDTYINGYGYQISVLIHSTPSNFYSPCLDADTIFLNGYPIEKGLDEDTNAYFDFASFYNINIENGTNWFVKGKGTVPSMAYNDSKKNPDYIGHIPTITERKNGLTFTFDATTVLNADSVTVIYNYDSITHQGISRTFSANAGTVTISRKDIEPLDPDIHVVQIVPFSYSIQYFGGNPYAFIREKEIDRGIIVLH